MSTAPTGLSRNLDTPGKDPLTIGPVTFNSIEAPSKLPIGALEQKIVVKELIGGGRDTQSLGAQPKSVQWSGSFFQPNIDGRVTTLLSMAADGKEYLLTWRIYRYYCKVKSFTPGHRNGNWCEYEIDVEITRDANGSLSPTAPLSLDQQVGTITTNIQTQTATLKSADPTGWASISAAIAKVQGDIALAGPLAQLAGPGLQSILSDLTGAISTVNAYAQNQTDGTPAFLAAQQLITSLILLQKNVTQGQSQNTIRVQGMSLFHVASMVYGDVSQAFALMQANNMISPFTSRQVPTVILLPPLPATT